MPESPRWLILEGTEHDEALAVLMQVRSEERARPGEMEEVEFLAARGGEESLTWGAGATSRTPWICRIFIAGIGVAIAQQCTGINSIMYYRAPGC